MKRKIDITLLIKIVLLFILFSILFYAYYASKLDAEKQIVVQTIITTPTCVPSPTNTPVPTATPTPSPSPTSTPTPTPIAKTEKEEIELSQMIIEEALERTEETLEMFSTGEKTLYNTYSENELELLFRVVEAETTDGDVESKSHVASVIFNRLKEGWWGGNITKSLMAKNQYEVVTSGRYKRVTVTEETILACEIAFHQDTAQGALFFDSTDGKSWAHRNRTFIFRDRIGHNFYK